MRTTPRRPADPHLPEKASARSADNGLVALHGRSLASSGNDISRQLGMGGLGYLQKLVDKPRDKLAEVAHSPVDLAVEDHTVPMVRWPSWAVEGAGRVAPARRRGGALGTVVVVPRWTTCSCRWVGGSVSQRPPHARARRGGWQRWWGEEEARSIHQARPRKTMRGPLFRGHLQGRQRPRPRAPQQLPPPRQGKQSHDGNHSDVRLGGLAQPMRRLFDISSGRWVGQGGRLHYTRQRQRRHH